MSRVDEELARAVAESEVAAPAVDAPVVAAITPKPAPRRNLGLLVALLVMGGAILALIFTSFENAAVYARGVDELVREKEKLGGRNVRVEGTLVKGTLVRRDDPCEYRFDIQAKGVTLPVRYPQCIVPDTFRDVPGMDVSVTAEGTLSQAGHFEASHIMAKCPSKYEMQERAKNGETMPHDDVLPAAVIPQN